MIIIRIRGTKVPSSESYHSGYAGTGQFKIQNRKETAMTKITETALITEEQNPLRLMSEAYDRDAHELEIYIGKLKEQIKSKPEPDELDRLERLLRVCKDECRDLLSSAIHMKRLASPPPTHPSLLRRERDAS
jgi:hypothetical protein